MKAKPKAKQKRAKREWKEWRLVDTSDEWIPTFAHNSRADAIASRDLHNDYKPGPYRVIRVSVREI